LGTCYILTQCLMSKSILQKVLASLARATIRKYEPIVVGVTGSVGKTSTREAIFSVVRTKWNARASEKNFNNEMGLPLTILGIPSYGRNVFAWCRAMVKAWLYTKFRRIDYPAVLILEYAVDRPGDMDYLLSIVKPKIAVVTAIGEVPVHVEFFSGPEELAQEKAKLVEAVFPDGYIILNHDDYAVYDMKVNAKGRVMTFGFEKHAGIRITNYELRVTKDAEVGDVPAGTSFKIEYNGSVVPVRLYNVFGEPNAYAAAAAIGVGLVLNMNLIESSRALEEFRGVPGRLRLLDGIKYSSILDDSYNAAPDAMRSALDTLNALPGRRKIAVLGDMLEVGRYTEQVHRAIGDRAAEFVDVLFTVGPRAKFIADEALTRGVEPNARKLTHERVYEFDDALSAGKALDPMIKRGDLILVKGSESMRMEKVVEEIMRYPLQAERLLVRQDTGWKEK
jgi:UDP-N-acetylmuramoyl-tripeptide--D-alanyl-D-alanine ligase